MKKLREFFWIWGHPTDSLYGNFGINRHSAMSPVDGMEYLGARNVFYVPMGITTDRRTESEKLRKTAEFGWSVENAANNHDAVTEIVRLSEDFPNLKKAVFDDFFNEENTANNYLLYTPELLSHFRNELHNSRNPIEMWMVLYTKQFGKGLELRRFTDEFDGISLWFWNEDDVKNFDSRVSEFFALTENKKRLIGCYLYDFGGEKPASRDTVLYQLDRHREFILQGKTDGVILHTNAVADFGHEGVQAAKEWLEKHGDEPVGV